MSENGRLFLLLLIGLAPVTLVAIVAMIRGYTIKLLPPRRFRRRRDDEEE